MGKKLLTFVLLLSVVPWTFATMPLSPGMWITPDYPIKYAKPFLVVLGVYFGYEATSASLDITLPDGVQLLEGKLHWQGKIGKNENYGCGSILHLQINKPGSYEITGIFNATDSLNPKNHLKTPWRESLFLYAREDTVLDFVRRSEMERAIRDSSVYSGVLERRTEERNHYQYFLQGAKMNATPFTLSSDLAELTRDIPLYPDSTKYKDLSSSFDSNQVKLIKKYTLLYALPRYDRIEYALSLDFMDRITKEQLQSMVSLVTKQITELYELDQKILRMNPSDERTKSLRDRAVLLKKQNTERNAVMEKK